MKTFTLEEANQLLPVLESLLRQALENKTRLEQLQKEAQQVVQRVFLSGGTLLKISDMLVQKAERERVGIRVQDLLAEILATGVQVKDLEVGLLDFPCEIEGEVILLCWKLGESTVAHWHRQDEGFRGRKPIDGRIAGFKKPN